MFCMFMGSFRIMKELMLRPFFFMGGFGGESSDNMQGLEPGSSDVGGAVGGAASGSIGGAASGAAGAAFGGSSAGEMNSTDDAFLPDDPSPSSEGGLFGGLFGGENSPSDGGDEGGFFDGFFGDD